jgi:hypothetical protein
MNVELGVNIQLGITVKDIEIDRNAGHVVTTDSGKIRCKWLVDASGFNTLLGRKFNLIEPFERHPVSSRWGRFRNTSTPSSLGNNSWRERVNYMNRFLSTTHFMYKGYWFWVIPIDEVTFSIGIVWRHDLADIDIKSCDEFEAFINKHKGLSEVLGDSYEIVDYHGLKNMARIAKQFYSPDRWFLTGMSAGFLDPLFSSGSAFIAEQNKMIVDLIATDKAALDYEFKNKAACYDAHSHWWLDNFLLHICGNYHGSFDLHDFLFDFLLADYFGLILPAAMTSNWGYDPSVEYGDGRAYSIKLNEMIETGVSKKVHSLQHQLSEFIDSKCGIFANNANQFSPVSSDKDYMKYSRSRGKKLIGESIPEIQKSMLINAYQRALIKMAEISDVFYSTEDLIDVSIEATERNMRLIDAFSRLTESFETTAVNQN